MITARKLNISFGVLVTATIVTWLIGEWWSSHAVLLPVMGAMLALTFIKCRLIVLDFMGLRPVKSFWRSLVLGWVVVVLAVITLAYFVSLN